MARCRCGEYCVNFPDYNTRASSLFLNVPFIHHYLLCYGTVAFWAIHWHEVLNKHGVTLQISLHNVSTLLLFLHMCASVSHDSSMLSAEKKFMPVYHLNFHYDLVQTTGLFFSSASWLVLQSCPHLLFGPDYWLCPTTLSSWLSAHLRVLPLSQPWQTVTALTPDPLSNWDLLWVYGSSVKRFAWAAF